MGNASAGDDTASVYIGAAQISLDYNFISTTNQKVIYSFAIQRSTQRFHEEFHAESDTKGAGQSSSGRCIAPHEMVLEGVVF